MDWSNESYVRVYTRDNEDWLVLSWMARALLVFILRKVDRAGVLETRRGAAGISVIVGMPAEAVAEALPELLIGEGAPLIEHQRGYLVRNFIEAQEASKSDRLRAKQSRERRRDRAAHGDVTYRDSVTRRDDEDAERDDESRSGTEGHARSRAVTLTSADPYPNSGLPPRRDRAPAQGRNGEVRSIADVLRGGPRAADARERAVPGDGARALQEIEDRAKREAVS